MTRTAAAPPLPRQAGWSLTEVMVAAALGLGVIASASMLVSSLQKSHQVIDAQAQLRDNARFSSQILQRVIAQAGALSAPLALERTWPSQWSDYDAEPHLNAFNNAQYRQALAIGTSTSISSSQRGVNGSDLLIVRYQPQAHGPLGTSDHSTINCAGHSESLAPDDKEERLFSVFHISTNQGEPTLMCTYRNEASGKWVTQPLVTGVETFQVLVGTSGVTATRAPSSPQWPLQSDFVEQYLRPDQLLVSGNARASYANWSRVKTVRIGMVLRAAPGTAAATVQTYYAFGTPWLCQSADTGCAFSAPADGRMRHSVSFTVYLRNPQSTQ
ncbi:MAG: PilW family protein [Comamonas sp.]